MMKCIKTPENKEYTTFYLTYLHFTDVTNNIRYETVNT